MKAIAMSGLIGGVLLLAGCGGGEGGGGASGGSGASAEAQPVLDHLEGMTAMLQGVETVEQAQAIAPQLEAKARQFGQHYKQLINARGGGDAQQWAADLKAVSEKMSAYMQAWMRIAAQNPRIREALADAQNAVTDAQQQAPLDP